MLVCGALFLAIHHKICVDLQSKISSRLTVLLLIKTRLSLREIDISWCRDDLQDNTVVVKGC